MVIASVNFAGSVAVRDCHQISPVMLVICPLIESLGAFSSENLVDSKLLAFLPIVIIPSGREWFLAKFIPSAAATPNNRQISPKIIFFTLVSFYQFSFEYTGQNGLDISPVLPVFSNHRVRGFYGTDCCCRCIFRFLNKSNLDH